MPIRIKIQQNNSESDTDREKLNTSELQWDLFAKAIDEEVEKVDWTSLYTIEQCKKMTSIIKQPLVEQGAKISGGKQKQEKNTRFGGIKSMIKQYKTKSLLIKISNTPKDSQHFLHTTKQTP